MTDKSARSKRRILEAAIEEFSQKGPSGARINRIAEKAGINKERIYAYFGSKDALFQAVIACAFNGLKEHDSALLSLTEKEIPRLTEILLRHNMAAHQAEPNLWRILAWENLTGGKHGAAISDIDERGYRHLESLYAIGQKQGVLKKGISFATYISVLMGLSFFYHSNQRTMCTTVHHDYSKQDSAEKFIEEALRLIQ